MTSPQDPWQQYPHTPYQQQAYPQQVTPSGGFAQQGGFHQSPQQPGYPQPNPYAAPSLPQPDGAGAPEPSTVNAAFWTAIGAPVVYTVLAAVMSLLMFGMFDEFAEANTATAADRQAAETVATGIIGLFVLLLLVCVIMTGLWILFGFKMRAGHNWARITLTVFAGVWIMFALGALIWRSAFFAALEGRIPGAVIATSYTMAAVALVGMGMFIVLSYLKPSNWYFQATPTR